MSKPQSRNWTREARRSAPTRIPRTKPVESAFGAASPPSVRERYAVVRQVKRRNTDLSSVTHHERPARQQDRRRASQVPDSDSEDSDKSRSPVGRISSSKEFSRTGTGDLPLDDEDDSDSSYNSFNLSMQKKGLFREDEAPLMTASSADASDRPPQATTGRYVDGAERDRLVQVYRVYRSHYNGDLFQDGNLSAHVTTGTNRKMFQRELSKPLFRWVHIENPTMNFSQFVGMVLECPWLDAGEKDSLTSILRVSRQKSEHSLRMPEGKKGSYVEPEYYEENIQETLYRGFRSRRQKTEQVRWMCVPYFAVGEPTKKHNKEETSRAPDFSRVTQFLNSGFTMEGEYFQIAQLWTLLVGDSILITCARRPIPDIPGNQINIETLPPANPDRRGTGDRAPVFIVSDGGIRNWLLPVDKCLTWLEFTSNFAELNVDFSEDWDLLYQDTKITRQDWPQLIKLAQRMSIRLVLRQAVDNDDNDDSDEWERSSVNGMDSSKQEPIAPKNVSSENSKLHPSLIDFSADESPSKSGKKLYDWHIFTLLATHVTYPDNQSPADQGTQNPTSPKPVLHMDEKTLKEDSDDVDRYLSHINRRRGENLAYTHCPLKTMEEVENYLQSLQSIQDQASNNIMALKLKLFRGAKNIFTFFYPLDYDHRVVSKFWGAIDAMMRSGKSTITPGRLQQLAKNVHALSHTIIDLKEELFSRQVITDNQTNIPHEFLQAWMLCLMYLILFTTDQANRSSRYLRRSKALLVQGKMKIIQRLQTVSLREKEAVSPLGIVSMLIGQLLQDTRGGPLFFDRHRLAMLYWEDVQALTDEVRNDPLDRRYQERFVFLKSELETVTGTLEDQQRVLVALDDSINEEEAKSVTAQLSNRLYQKGREASIIEFSLDATEETLQNFLEMSRKVAELESWYFRMIDANKDRQEKAALAFTTVTVFFLPLTMLASVFGMNSSDIRDMEATQGLFWAISIPLCACGLILWLLYLGTIQYWMKGIKRLKRSRGRLL